MKIILTKLKIFLLICLLVIPYFVMAEEKPQALSNQAKVEFYNIGLFHAAKKGKLEQVRYAVENGADVNAADEEGITPLMAAAIGDDFFEPAHEGHLAVVKYLVEQGANVNA